MVGWWQPCVPKSRKGIISYWGLKPESKNQMVASEAEFKEELYDCFVMNGEKKVESLDSVKSRMKAEQTLFELNGERLKLFYS